MRTFIAIEIPDPVKQQMAEVQSGLRNAGVDASWPKPEGIHLTLKFLGEIPETKLVEIQQALTAALENMSRFRLEIRGTGTFPNPRNARVVWVGVSGEVESLNRLQRSVEDAIVGIGMEPEDRPFKAHLTLGRIKYIRSKEAWLKALDRAKDITLPGFEVKAVSVMKSELKRTGAEYAEMARIELK